MNLPKISIVTPSYNQGRYLEETILSVINQHYPNLEYIIIDGGSDDNSIDIIKKYSSHINYWVSEKDSGQSEAINKGFRKCTGDIVTWLNSDDYYPDGTLLKVGDYFSKGNFALLYGKSVLFGAQRKDMVIGLKDRENAVIKSLSFVPFPQPSTFFKRQLLDDQGDLDENLHFCMDHDLLVRIVLNYDIYGVDDVFSKYRYHATGKSSFPLKFAEERTKIFSTVLRSFPGTESLVQILKDLGLHSEGKDRYNASKSFSFNELKKALVYFLEVQMHYYYDALDKKKSKAIAKFLLSYNDPLIMKDEAKSIFLRTSVLNKHLIFFLRKFTRN
jgi:glycosyltransferase involved in cell wall biosynthesis